MLKILADRFAEAFAELIHLKIRTELWGYAKDEDLAIDELFLGKYQGIRPAPGYPSCPDHTEKKNIFKLLNVSNNIGITLTDTLMMLPLASECSWCFANSASKYFNLSKIDKEQLNSYANRKEISVEQAEKLLGTAY